MWPPQPHRQPRAHRPDRRPGQLRAHGYRPLAHRPPRLQGPAQLRRSHPRQPAEHGPARRRGYRYLPHQWTAPGPWSDGFPLHGRLDGFGGGREAHPPDRNRHRPAHTGADCLRLRWCPHAGGDAELDADGQDLRSPGAAPPGRAALPAPAHLPHHRGCNCQLRHVGRLNPGRAQGPDRLRRPPGDRADPARKAARGLPNRRIPARPRLR